MTDLLDKLPMTGTFEGEKFFVQNEQGLQAIPHPAREPEAQSLAALQADAADVLP